ncbi:hypothetical protein GCM10025854_17770 [Tetragenococcus muriaticus]|nr:hypothetical protein GCM10025854_17770 [Tetragenococcus muriaticus]
MTELAKYIGPNTDIPAGDIGVGPREIGYLYGMYKRIKQYDAGVLTGKPLDFWGSKGRTEATGYGTVYFVKHLLADRNENLKGKTAAVSGSGNVAIYAIEKIQELGGKPVTCSDSNGYIYDEEGIDLALLKQVKEVDRDRLTAYAQKRPQAQYHKDENVWDLKANYDLAFPCATQNEIDETQAQTMVSNGVRVVAEGANMPCSIEAAEYFMAQNVVYCPGKAANAGGVAVSALEMSQNAQRLQWEKEDVDKQLNTIMKNIYESTRDAAKEYGSEKNFMLGANIAGFSRVAKAMTEQGLV